MKHPGITEVYGSAAVRTSLSLEETAKIISKQLFGGMPFGGKEKSIWEEVPAVYINTPILGSLVILGRGNNQGMPGNCFVLKVSPWGDFDRYIYKNKISNRRLSQDNTLYHLLKFGLQNFPEVEVLEPDSKNDKDYLFKLADRVVYHFEKRFNYDEDPSGLFFDESIINKTALKISFSNVAYKIVCSLSLHHLDTPWAFQVKIILAQGAEFELNKWKAEGAESDQEAYEVSPILLEDPEGLGDALAMTIAGDTFVFYREIKAE